MSWSDEYPGESATAGRQTAKGNEYKMKLYASSYDSPVGKISTLCSDDRAIRICFENEGNGNIHEYFQQAFPNAQVEQAGNSMSRDLGNQLEEYFSGARKEFTIELELIGTRFQKRVWHELLVIPYGTTLSYGELAKRAGSVARAVGGANGANPIPIIVPCHRVIASDGDLCGFGGGLDVKRFLLELEGIEVFNGAVRGEPALF